MFRAFSLAVDQLADRRILWVLAKSLVITLVLCLLLGLALGEAVQRLVGDHLIANPDAGALMQVARAVLLLLVVVFCFRLIAVPVIGVFADEVVAAVEARHYPHAAANAQRAGFGLSLKLGLMSVVRLLLWNLLALPGYLVLIFTAIGPLALFLLVNALLLGRDMGEMVAVRHLPTDQVKRWLQGSRGPRAALGTIVTGLFMIPLLNVVAPIIGAAMATHLFHRGMKK